jgi:hypothetical protein
MWFELLPFHAAEPHGRAFGFSGFCLLLGFLLFRGFCFFGLLVFSGFWFFGLFFLGLLVFSCFLTVVSVLSSAFSVF